MKKQKKIILFKKLYYIKNGMKIINIFQVYKNVIYIIILINFNKNNHIIIN